MSFFKRLGASLGIGAATVETVLQRNQFRPGDKVQGVIYVKGGAVEQEIEDIDLNLFTQYAIEKDDQRVYERVKIASYRVVNGFTIFPNEKREFPFNFTLPLDTPITFGQTRVWVNTAVDIERGVDSEDNDPIQVVPHPFTFTVLEAVQSLGFRLHEADCEHAPYFRRRLPFVQEFEFVPTTNRYRSRLDELEVVCHVDPHGIEVALEIDRKARGIIGWLEENYGMDERLVRAYFSNQEMEQGPVYITRKLQEIIDRHAR
jgi:sporulation-control protein